MAKNKYKYFEINSFSGGLNTKPYQALIDADEANIIEDCDLDTIGSLDSMYDKSLYISKSNTKAITRFNDNLLYSDTSNLYKHGTTTAIDTELSSQFQSTIHGNFIYLLDGTYFKKYDDTNITQVGIESPSAAPTVEAKAKYEINNCETVWRPETNVTTSLDSSDYKSTANSVQISVGEDFTTGVAAYHKTSDVTIIDSCDSDWVSDDANVLVTHFDFSPEGLACIVTIFDAHTTGLVAHHTISSTDLSSYTKVCFWAFSNVALDSGDMQFLLDDTADCSSPIETLDIPAITANTWTWVELTLATPASDTAIVSVGLNMAVDKGAMGFYIDEIQTPGSNYSSYESLGFYIKVDKNIEEGDLQLVLGNDSRCVSEADSLNIPALLSDTWTYVVIDFTDASTLTDVHAVGLKIINDIGITVIHIDSIEADAGPLSGEYTYYYTYASNSYHTGYTFESALSPASSTLTLDNERVDLSALAESTDPQVDTIYIYRIGGTLSEIYRSTSMTVDNGTTTYTDSESDSLMTVLNDSDDHNSPQSNVGKYIEYCDNRMFMAGYSTYPNRLYISKSGTEIEAWPTTYYIDFNAEITGIKNLNGTLLIFTELAMYRLVGSSPGDYTNELITNQTPLLTPYTLAQYGTYIFYPSTDGIYATDGYTVIKITDKIDSKFSTIDTTAWGEIYGHKYFLTYNSETIITDLIQFPDNIKFVTYNYNPNCYYYDRTSNILYSGDSTGIHQIEKATTQLEFTWQKNEITCSTSDTSLFNIYKYLRKIWINVSGTLTLYLYLDESDTAFLTKSITTTSMSRQEISLPYNTLCKKFDIKFVCTGRVDPPITIMYTVNNLQ